MYRRVIAIQALNVWHVRLVVSSGGPKEPRVAGQIVCSSRNRAERPARSLCRVLGVGNYMVCAEGAGPRTRDVEHT